jgi:hypothetical protein
MLLLNFFKINYALNNSVFPFYIIVSMEAHLIMGKKPDYKREVKHYKFAKIKN